MLQTMKKKPEFKQMSFDTAVRNPERYIGILKSIEEYNGVILNDDNLLKIVSKLYLEKEVTSDRIAIDKNSNIDSISNKVKEVNITRKADGGYPKGYQSRFWTYVRTLSELGFVYAQYKEKFIISEVATELLNGNIDEQEAFSLQMMRANRKSPYRNVLNDYNYLKFIIKILIELKRTNKKLSYNEFILSTFNKNDDVESFLNILIKEKDVFTNSVKTYEYIKKNFPKVNIEKTVMRDYPDVVLRLLRITGLVTITNHANTIYLELNSNKLDYYRDLIKYDFKLSENEKDDKVKYFNRISYLDQKLKDILISHREKEVKIINYNDIINNIIENYNLNKENVVNSLKKIESTRSKENLAFKYIPTPLKFEFFISIFMYFSLGKDYKIKPNYKMDSNGLPISHAPGNKGDIEIFSDKIYWVLEVSLIRNKTQQYNNETTNLMRHLSNEKGYQEYFLSFIAPFIHQDTQRLFDALIITLKIEENMENIYGKTFKLEEFIEKMDDKNIFEEIKNYTKEYTKKLKEKLS